MKKESGTTSSLPSAHVVGSLDDLILQILSRVPAKPLARLKLVSKHWESLITTHQLSFLRKQGALGLICPGKRIPSFEFIPFDDNNSRPFSELRFPWGLSGGLHWIHQSCNGLLLCCNGRSRYLDPNILPAGALTSIYSSACSVWFPKLSCCVYNPTTRCFAQIPRPDGYPSTMLGLSLAYDPDKLKSPGYKVLFIYRGDGAFKIEIYSSDSRTWSLYDKPCIFAKANFSQGVYWNGSMHWINRLGKQLLYFNLDKEELGTVLLPSTLMHNDNIGFPPMIGYFGESGDHLHIVEICDENKAVFNVHEMKRDYSGWFVRYRVDLTTSICNIGNNNNNTLRIFSLVRGEEGKCRSFLFFLLDTGKFSRWNLDRNIVEEIFENKNIVTEYRVLPYAFKYIESLASV